VSGALAIQLQRALELGGGSRWLAAVLGEGAIAAALIICLARTIVPRAQTRDAWTDPSRA
jgi:hypothetical protein